VKKGKKKKAEEEEEEREKKKKKKKKKAEEEKEEKTKKKKKEGNIYLKRRHTLLSECIMSLLSRRSPRTLQLSPGSTLQHIHVTW
jgi:hypothetical protein